LDNIEVQILDSDNSILGTLTVADSDKFPLSLTKSLANLKNINERSGSYSTSFKIASTKDNDVLLEHLYYASEKNYKDWDADKRARIIVNGIDIDTGRLRVDRVSAKGNARDYNFTFFGDNMDWVLLMQDKYFADLPYLDQSISYDATVVENSWSNTFGNNTPVFSLINRGARLKADMTSVEDYFPDYFTYDVIKNAFKLIGYNVESTFIEQNDFKELITPFFGNNFRITDEDLEAQAVYVKLDNSITNFDSSFTAEGSFYPTYFFLDNSYSSTGGLLPWFSGTNSVGFTETTPYYDNGSNWDAHTGYSSNTTYVYTAPLNGYYKLDLDCSATQSADNGVLPNLLSYKVYRRIGTSSPSIIGNMTSTSLTNSGYIIGSTNYRNTHGVFESASHYLNAGERIWIGGISGVNGNGSGSTNISLKHHDNTTVKVTQLSTLVSGNTFNWNEVSDNQFSLLKYITDLGKLFNWYFRTNTSTRTVYIETRDDFYKSLSTATNWTDKIDDNKQHELYYNSKYYTQLQKFNYAEDSDDEFLGWWNDRVSGDFQNLTHEYPEKFKTGTTTLQLDTIAPTISSGDPFTGGNEPITSFLWDKEPNTGIPPLRLGYKPRLLYYNYSTQQGVDGASKYFYFNDEATPRYTIPYAISFKRVVNNITLADCANTLDFKDLISFYSTGSVLDTSVTVDGLYTQYYQKTTREILEGKRLHIDLFIDLVDYKNLDLREPIYFDNRYSDIEGYWRIERISNFKAIGTRSTRFELTQAKNFTKLPYNSLTGNVFTDYTEGQEGMRLANTTNGGRVSQDSKTNILGFNNIVEPKTTVVGDYLESSAPSTTRLGRYNLDVSTDTFQLGVGTTQEPFSLIRSDSEGNIYFNGELIKGDDLIVNVNVDTSATVSVKTYLCDTTSNEITITLPLDANIGKEYNIKKMSSNYDVIIIVEGGATIDDKTEVRIGTKYTSAKLQFDGVNYIII